MRHLLILTTMAALAGAETYSIQPAPDAQVALEIYKTGLLSGKKHLFVFERYQGTLEFDAKAPEQSKVEISIEAESLVIKDTWLKGGQFKEVRDYALGKDMLETSKHKQLRFVSRQISRNADGTFAVTGDLFVRGVARAAMVAVKMDAQGGRILFDGTSEIRIKDYGLKPPSAALGAIGTKNEMKVMFKVQATKRG